MSWKDIVQHEESGSRDWFYASEIFDDAFGYVPEEHMNEKWMAADDAHKYYESDHGRLYCAKTNTILAEKRMDRHGHIGAGFCYGDEKKYIYAHRLAAEKFIPNPEKHPNVLHWDDDPTNNYIENLRWGTQKDNYADCVRNGHAYIITDEDREKGFIQSRTPVMATDLSTGDSLYFRGQGEASSVLNIPQANIWKVMNGERKTAGGYTFSYAERRDA